MNRRNCQAIAQMDQQVGDVICAYGAEWVNCAIHRRPGHQEGLPVVATTSLCIASDGWPGHGWRIGGSTFNFQGNRLAGHQTGFRPSAIYQGCGVY